MQAVGRILLVLAAVMGVAGVVLMVAGKLDLGSLPGDLVWRRGRVTIFFPLATSLALSLLLTLVAWLLSRR
ncbi:MAG: DUF2905 family protein [Acidobacteriota bacterium]|jgi:hypothetical protein